MAIATVTDSGATSVGQNNTKGLAAFALRAALVPTTSYVASSHMPCGSAASVGIYVTYASADYTSLEMWVEGSVDASTWSAIMAPRGAVAHAAFAQTLANLESATDQTYHVTVPVEAGIHYLRVKIKRTGGTAVGTVAVTGYTGAGV